MEEFSVLYFISYICLFLDFLCELKAKLNIHFFEIGSLLEETEYIIFDGSSGSLKPFQY